MLRWLSVSLLLEPAGASLSCCNLGFDTQMFVTYFSRMDCLSWISSNLSLKLLAVDLDNASYNVIYRIFNR